MPSSEREKRYELIVSDDESNNMKTKTIRTYIITYPIDNKYLWTHSVISFVDYLT